LTVVALTVFLRITDANGVLQGLYQNGKVGQAIRLEGRDFLFLPFLYAGATKNRTGDNLEASLVLASNKLAMNITTQAVESKWNVEVVSCSMHPETWEVGRVLSREYWVAASQSYDPVQVEVLLSSGIDAVGASAPTRALTSRIVGSLPSSGAISNL
jgi:hypothetical protein